MKIQQTKVNFVRLPLEEPLVGAPYMPGMLREFFTVQIRTDEGIEGIGVTGFGGKLVRALDRKSTRLNSSHSRRSRMPSSA